MCEISRDEGLKNREIIRRFWKKSRGFWGRHYWENYRIHPKYGLDKLFSLAFFSNSAKEQVLI